MARNKSRKGTAQAASKPVLEWVASISGLMIVAGLAAVLSWEGLKQTEALPAVLIEQGRIMESRHSYTVEFVARNITGVTASDVLVEGVLRRNGEIVETAQSRMDYVPGSSVRRGGLFFTRDPREHDLALRALGYSEP
jgi:uncharacterized protein (TIGR02588 family)